MKHCHTDGGAGMFKDRGLLRNGVRADTYRVQDGAVRHYAGNARD